MEYAPTAATIDKQYDLVLDEAALAAVAAALRAAGRFGAARARRTARTPMNAPNPRHRVATGPRTAWYVPVGQPTARPARSPGIPACRSQTFSAALGPLLSDAVDREKSATT